MCKKSSLLTLAVLFLLNTSCIPSVNPISDPSKAKVDKSLFGKWEFKYAGVDLALMEISAHPLAGKGKTPSGIMLAKFTNLARDLPELMNIEDKQKSLEFPLFVTTIRSGNFFNLGFAGQLGIPEKKIWKKSEFNGFFGKYILKEDLIEIVSESAPTLIKNKVLKGVLKPPNGERLDQSYLTDTTENLHKFLSNRPGSFWDPPVDIPKVYGRRKKD